MSSERDRAETKIRELLNKMRCLQDRLKEAESQNASEPQLPINWRIPHDVNKSGSPTIELRFCKELTIDNVGDVTGTLSLQINSCQNDGNGLLQQAT